MEKPSADQVLTYGQLLELETRAHADELLAKVVKGPYTVAHLRAAKLTIQSHMQMLPKSDRGFYEYMLQQGSPQEIVQLANGLVD